MRVAWTRAEALARPSVPILVVRSTVIVRFLGDQICSPVHYLENRGGTRPCTKSIGGCPSCEKGFGRRFVGYAPVEQYTQPDGKPVWLKRVLSIPAGNVEELAGTLTGRACRIEIRQQGFRKEYLFKLDGEAKPCQHEWFDVRPILEAHWFPKASQLTIDDVPDEPDIPSSQHADSPILAFPRKRGVA